MESMKILLVAAEMAPLAQVGGLGDVVGSLPGALVARGHDVRVLIPAYQQNLTRDLETRVRLGTGQGRIVETNQSNLPCPVWLLETPAFLRRRGRPYVNKAGTPWADNADEFGTLSRTAASIASGTLGMGWQPDIVHCNDWHTGLTPIWMGLEGRQRHRYSPFTTPPIPGAIHRRRSSGLGFPITFIIPMLWSSTGAFRC